jgi:hypothetical protein
MSFWMHAAVSICVVLSVSMCICMRCGVDVKIVSWGVVVVAIAQQLLGLCTTHNDDTLLTEREREILLDNDDSYLLFGASSYI